MISKFWYYVNMLIILHFFLSNFLLFFVLNYIADIIDRPPLYSPREISSTDVATSGANRSVEIGNHVIYVVRTWVNGHEA